MSNIWKKVKKVLANFCYFLAIIILLTTIAYSLVAWYKGIGGWGTQALASLVLSGILIFLGKYYD